SAAVGLWGLWRAQSRAAEEWEGRLLGGGLLIGFGLWHVLDGVLSHWVLGIHRIKLDSDTILLWDLIWFVAFGLVPMAAGRVLVRRGRAALLRGSTVATLLVTVATAGAGAWALMPPPDQAFTTVVFRADYGPPRIFAALASADARL